MISHYRKVMDEPRIKCDGNALTVLVILALESNDQCDPICIRVLARMARIDVRVAHNCLRMLRLQGWVKQVPYQHVDGVASPPSQWYLSEELR
jgi:hypothetical protein